MQLILQASNIKCGGCASTIEEGLNQLEGISDISVDIDSNKVKIDGENIDKKTVESKLAELGYPVI